MLVVSLFVALSIDRTIEEQTSEVKMNRRKEEHKKGITGERNKNEQKRIRTEEQNNGIKEGPNKRRVE